MSSHHFPDLGQVKIQTVSQNWTPGILLSMSGLFYLKDIAPILELNTSKIKAASYRLSEKGEDALKIMGVCRHDQQWLVDIERFSHYYFEHLVPGVKKVKPEWNGNDLLRTKGIFYLADVCEKIPFTAQQLRYQATKSSGSRAKYGIWKDHDLGTYLVDMEVFGPWIAHLWLVEVTGRVTPEEV